MKIKIILLFFIIVLLPCSIVFAQSKIDVLHYKFEIELNDNNDSITVIATIDAKFLESTDSVMFDVPQTDEKNDKTPASLFMPDTNYYTKLVTDKN